MKAISDDPKRLRDLVKAMAEHGPATAMRMEFVINDKGCRLIATHPGGVENEKMLCQLFAMAVHSFFGPIEVPEGTIDKAVDEAKARGEG